MMHDFLSDNRLELIERCRAKVMLRASRAPTAVQIENGIPLFLEQLIRTVEVEQGATPMDSRKISGPAGGGAALSEIGVTAAEHGRELLLLGFTVDQVVHDYGDLCQAVTDLAFERDAPFAIDEFRTLNRCLDNAIADAVTEFGYQRDTRIAGATAAAETERLGFFAHELRNHLFTATIAFTAARAGNLPLSGATGSVLERSLIGLRKLIDRSLAEVRLATGPVVQLHLFSVAEFIAEVEHAAALSEHTRGCRLVVSVVDPVLAFCADRDLLAGAVGNLVHNAFKFTKPNTEIALDVHADGDRILIHVGDHCGGLAPAVLKTMFAPFTQAGNDKSGLGLGLSIARRSVELNNGTISVKSVTGVGCVITISLPRHSMLAQSPAMSAKSISATLDALGPEDVRHFDGTTSIGGIIHAYSGRFAVLTHDIIWEADVSLEQVAQGHLSASMASVPLGTEEAAVKMHIALFVEQGRWVTGTD